MADAGLRPLFRLLAVTAAALAVAVTVPAPAQAHAGLGLVVNDDGRGNVSVDVAWADGHPVTEGIAGTLLAVRATGVQVGPAPLRRLPGTSTLVLPSTLPVGAWQVTVDVALPGIGRCEAPVTVPAADTAARPGSTRCAPPPAAAEQPAPPAASPAWPVVVPGVVGAAGVLGVLGWSLLRSRRSRR